MPAKLRVTPDGRRLETAGGQPFFWLADTAWSLLYRFDDQEVEHYFQTRRAQGFNVLQICLLSELDGLSGNLEGQTPFLEGDPLQPNEAFFARAERICDLATELGFYLALFPVWGNFVAGGLVKYPSQVIFDQANALEYGRFLGRRFAARDNVVWVLGGDRPVLHEGSDDRPVYRALSSGLREFMPDTLQSCHVNAEAESVLPLLGEDWLDFVMYQSGHGWRDVPIWAWMERDAPIGKPLLDGESAYEDHGVDPWEPHFSERLEYFRDLEVRAQIYRGVFAGGFGATYGHHAVWQGYDPARGREAVFFPDRPWQEALVRPGAYQMGFLRGLLESRPARGRIPDQGLLPGPVGHALEHARALRDGAGRWAMVYLSGSGRAFTVNPSSLTGECFRAWWFEPRSGGTTLIGERPRAALLEFLTPQHAPDWVLVLEDVRSNFGAPGRGSTL